MLVESSMHKYCPLKEKALWHISVLGSINILFHCWYNFFISCQLVASKFLHDDGEEESVSNYSWSVCAGLPLKRVNEIEKKFLQAIVCWD